MALVNCSECKKEVSEKAKTCPHCGYELISELDVKKKKKKEDAKNTRIGCLVVSAIILIIIIIISIGKDDKSTTSEPMTRQDSIESQFSAWNGSHPALTTMVKSAMHDSKSFEHVETRYADKDDYIFVIMQYRGNNVFGGKVVNSVSANVDFNGNVIEIVSQTP